MNQSSCICSSKSEFYPVISYKNETTFKDYEGMYIGKCRKCGMMKTVAGSSVKIYPEKSRTDFYEEHKDEFVRIFTPLVRLIQSFKTKGKVLDVGCASGIVLEMLEDKGYEVFGIEPNENSFKKVHKKFPGKILFGYLEQYPREKLFDVIIYNHVLEHVVDPTGELDEIHRHLVSGGVAVIGVPNRDNIIFTLRKKYWESLLPNEHIWHFSANDLKKLMEKSGLRIEAIQYDNHTRLDYPFIKRVYFWILVQINKLLKTGEAVTILAQKV